jgi:hypothetical protein
MPVKFFNTLINKIFKGTTEINKIYFGDNLIFDSAPPPAPPPTFTPPTPNFTPDFVPPQPNFVPDFVPNFVPDFVPNFVPNFTPPPPPTQVIARYFYLGSEWDSKFVDSGTAPGNPPRGNPPVAGVWVPDVTEPITSNTDYLWLEDSPPPPTFTPPTPNFTPDFVPPQPNFIPNFIPNFVPNFVPNFTPPPPPTQVIARYFYLGSEWDSKFVDSGTAPGNPPRGNPPVAGTWAPSVNDPITVNTDYFWLDDSPPPPTFTPPPPTFTPPTPNFTPPTPNFTPPTPNFTPPTPNFTPPPPPPYFSPFG